MTHQPDAAPDHAPPPQPGTRADREIPPPAALEPDADEVEVRRFPDGSREVRPDSDKYTGQPPPEEL